ncbi:hypothetical protein N803_14260 [Knoellia subterranea KCTC 19937]|uniref:DUF6318 domain-containing protein n=2 Tax=Knoellia TaxID=136099 RepID=A0A0A0JPT7_9MICO|nr:hypothetical protein N803_14260 [Knoellia subterranea KCTC 19937]
MPAAAAIACCLALSACGGDEPDVSGSLTSASTPSQDATQASDPSSPGQAAPVASEAPATPDATSVPSNPPSQPMSAQSQSPEGATIFLAHYVALLNWSNQAGNAGRLSAFEGPDCEKCQAQAKDITDRAGKKQHTAANRYRLDGIAAPANAATNPYVVPATLVQDATAVLDPAGATVGQLAASDTKVSYVLDWTGLGWQVTDIR